jgi:hypothetical protein
MNYIHQYVKNKKDKVSGVVVAVVDPAATSRVFIGWSSCAINKGDTFDKSRGVQIAVDRALKGSKVDMPRYLDTEFLYMADRARRYFKDKVVHA